MGVANAIDFPCRRHQPLGTVADQDSFLCGRYNIHIGHIGAWGLPVGIRREGQEAQDTNSAACREIQVRIIIKDTEIACEVLERMSSCQQL